MLFRSLLQMQGTFQLLKSMQDARCKPFEDEAQRYVDDMNKHDDAAGHQMHESENVSHNLYCFAFMFGSLDLLLLIFFMLQVNVDGVGMSSPVHTDKIPVRPCPISLPEESAEEDSERTWSLDDHDQTSVDGAFVEDDITSHPPASEDVGAADVKEADSGVVFPKSVSDAAVADQVVEAEHVEPKPSSELPAAIPSLSGDHAHDSDGSKIESVDPADEHAEKSSPLADGDPDGADVDVTPSSSGLGRNP